MKKILKFIKLRAFRKNVGPVQNSKAINIGSMFIYGITGYGVSSSGIQN